MTTAAGATTMHNLGLATICENVRKSKKDFTEHMNVMIKELY